MFINAHKFAQHIKWQMTYKHKISPCKRWPRRQAEGFYGNWMNKINISFTLQWTSNVHLDHLGARALNTKGWFWWFFDNVKVAMIFMEARRRLRKKKNWFLSAGRGFLGGWESWGSLNHFRWLKKTSNVRQIFKITFTVLKFSTLEKNKAKKNFWLISWLITKR